jgi:AraC-like DNA-binding protein
MDIIGSPNNPNNHIENECGTLLYCFATHLDYGLRFDGGIADRMKKSSYNSERSYYIYRFFYEELYFIALVMLMLNMIFGIIFEAFSELRNKEQAIEKDKKEICFICGMDKESCKKKGEKLDEHLEHVHNIWTYVEYIMGLRFVDLQETNAINSYVIESIEKKELLVEGDNDDHKVRMDAIAPYIMDNMANGITITELAREFAISERQLSRICNREYGVSAGEYIRSLQMEEAKHLLGDFDLSIADVANKVGYADYYAFCKAFKRMEGSSPAKFRLSLLK